MFFRGGFISIKNNHVTWVNAKQQCYNIDKEQRILCFGTSTLHFKVDQ